ncbi:hypothetical protein M8J75_012237 [Diaphorina citri]|nr:hypothetical protein M8J75_012237 [Diaphorina citri]
MKHYVFPTCWLILSTWYHHVDMVPIREKISINTDLLNKVREPANDTMGGVDRNARVHNFAWRITVTVTTTKPTPSSQGPTSTTPLSVDELEKHPDQNELIHNKLTYTLKDPTYRKVWDNLVVQGYDVLISEMRKPGAHKIFIKDNFDGGLEGPDGEKIYTKLVNFMAAIGLKGYKLLLDSASNNLVVESGESTTTTTTTTTTKRTTTPYIPKTTISAKEIEQNPEFFQNIYVQLSITLKNKEYRNKWNEIVNTEGYLILIEEMKKPGAHKIFMKDNGDKAFDGPEGAKLYQTLVNFLFTIGRTGYKTLLESVDEIPLVPGEGLGLTPPS